MDDAPSSTISDALLGEQLAQRLSEQRQKAESFLASHREEMLDAQTRLREQLQGITDQVARNEDAVSAARAELDQRSEQLDQRIEELDRRSEEIAAGKAELDARSNAWKDAQQEAIDRYESLLEQLRSERADLDTARQNLEQQRAEFQQLQDSFREESQQFSVQRQEIDTERECLGDLRQRLEARTTELDDREKSIAQRQTHTEIQRRKIAEELKAQRSSQLNEIERRRAELESHDAGEAGRLERQLKGVEQQRDSLKEELEALGQQCQEQTRLAKEQARAAEDLQGQLAEVNSRLESQIAELEASRNRHVELSAEIDQANCRASENEAQLNASRERQGELANELETLRGELAERAAELEAARGNEDKVREDLAAANARQTELVAELETVKQREAESQARIEAIEQQHEQWKTRLAESQQSGSERDEQLVSLQRRCEELEAAAANSDGAVGSEEYEALRVERDQLAAELDDTRGKTRELEQRLDEAAEGGGGDPELARRYEMAMDDVRELNQKVANLEQELEQAKSAGPSAQSDDSGGGLDWEAQKAKILAALESESEGDDSPEAAEERLRIEKVVNQTNSIVAERDAEIQELQRLLQDQSNNLGSVAVGAAALGEMFDQDEIIREERENLKRLQEQWEEKLRKAEIDLSVERAKIARERAELEERLHGSTTEETSEEVEDTSGKGGGRWLARLGLKDEEK